MTPDPIVFVKQNNHDVIKLKKKRGKYVEKRSSKLSNYSTSSRARTLTKSPVISPKARSPKRSPTNRSPPTSFVNSIFAIPSQNKPLYRQNNYDTKEYNLNTDLIIVPEGKRKQKEKKMNNRNCKIENPDKNKSPVNKSPKKKLKKVSNVEKNSQMKSKDSVDENLGRELDLIPSACSSFSRDGLSWMSYSDDDEIFINKEITDPLSNIDYENNQVVKEINEGKKINEEKSKHDTPEKGQDKAIYNFFVDVLHTIKPDYQIQLNKPIELKDSSEDLKNLEIDEKVAKKLAFSQKTNNNANIYGIDEDPSDSPAEHFEIVNLIPKRQNIIPYEPVPVRRKTKFVHPKPKSKPISQSSSFRKSSPKMSKKKRFLAMLKEQLTQTINQEYYEEPQSLYEALKIMAKNKTPTPQVRFQESRNTRKREIKPRKSRKLKKVLYDVRYPIEAEVNSRYLNNLFTSPRESLGSLQVYGEDYLYKNEEDYEIESNTTDLCNRFSIASFFGDQSSNLKTRSSPMSVTRRTVGNRSLSPFSLRSSRF